MPLPPEVNHQLQQAARLAELSEDIDGPITLAEKEIFELLVQYVQVFISEQKVTRSSNSAKMLEELVKVITGEPTATVRDLNPRLATLLVKAMHRLVDFV